MLLKLTIIILFIAVVASLTSGFIFLIKSLGAPDSKKTVYALGIRVILATTLMTVIGYGFYSGQLGSTAPWDRHIHAAPK